MAHKVVVSKSPLKTDPRQVVISGKPPMPSLRAKAAGRAMPVSRKAPPAKKSPQSR